MMKVHDDDQKDAFYNTYIFLTTNLIIFQMHLSILVNQQKLPFV